VIAATEPEVFAEALQAVRELLAEDGAPPPDPEEAREILLEGADRAVLLADWIAELAFLAETDSFVADSLDSYRAGRRIAARPRCAATSAARRTWSRPSPTTTCASSPSRRAGAPRWSSTCDGRRGPSARASRHG
jgi:hypothetical protein